MENIQSVRQSSIVMLVLGIISLALWFVVGNAGEQPFTTQTAGAASVDYYLKIDGLDGESSAAGHEGEMDVLSFEWGEDEPGIMAQTNSSGLPTGKRQHKPFVITKSVDKASPLLMEAVASGQQFSDATLFVQFPDGREYLEYKLKDVYITSYEVSGNSAEAPADTFSLNYEEIKQTYTPQLRDGSDGDPVEGLVSVSGTTKPSEPRE